LVGISLVFLAVAFSAAAQGPERVEVGASLMNLMIVIPQTGSRSILFGAPSGGGLLSPSVYAAIFIAPRFAIEPQVGLLVTSSGGTTSHALNVAGQVDYFVNGHATTSPYVFGAAGLDTVSNSDMTQFTGGAGYRIRFGDRLILRINGRYTHFTNGNGNAVGFNFSIGGVFGT